MSRNHHPYNLTVTSTQNGIMSYNELGIHFESRCIRVAPLSYTKSCESRVVSFSLRTAARNLILMACLCYRFCLAPYFRQDYGSVVFSLKNFSNLQDYYYNLAHYCRTLLSKYFNSVLVLILECHMIGALRSILL